MYPQAKARFSNHTAESVRSCQRIKLERPPRDIFPGTKLQDSSRSSRSAVPFGPAHGPFTRNAPEGRAAHSHQGVKSCCPSSGRQELQNFPHKYRSFEGFSMTHPPSRAIGGSERRPRRQVSGSLALEVRSGPVPYGHS